MLNKIRSFNRRMDLIRPGDTLVCAVSGGADSMALLWAMYLLKDEWDLDLHAAHFNHRLRGSESDRDQRFVEDFCRDYGIPLHLGSGDVVPGEKGLEAAARDARYAFFKTLPGKIATAHTADDNAETVLMRMVRGTGLKGLGAIRPVKGNVIRPLLTVTRQEVEYLLAEYSLAWITDSSNGSDDFLRNRLRHHVMPLLKAENPQFSENVSAMALRLRQDEQTLADLSATAGPEDVKQLRTMPPALRARALERMLKDWGVREPEASHIALAEALVFSKNPSARASFPGGITLGRVYDSLSPIVSSTPDFPEPVCREAPDLTNTAHCFTVRPQGTVYVRSRQSGDTIRLPGGTKSLKKLFIDRKIPAALRDRVPVICDRLGILAVDGIGVNLDRAADTLPAVRVTLNQTSHSHGCK